MMGQAVMGLERLNFMVVVTLWSNQSALALRIGLIASFTSWAAEPHPSGKCSFGVLHLHALARWGSYDRA